MHEFTNGQMYWMLYAAFLFGAGAMAFVFWVVYVFKRSAPWLIYGWSEEMHDARKLCLSLQPLLVRGALAEAEGWRRWEHKVLDYDPRWWRCRICGRQRDFVFDFVKLITLWDEGDEEVVKECYWHGPKEVVDLQTGEAIVIPEPPQWPRVQRFVEALVLYSAIVVRFCWYFLAGLFWRLVLSNEFTFKVMCAIKKDRSAD